MAAQLAAFKLGLQYSNKDLLEVLEFICRSDAVAIDRLVKLGHDPAESIKFNNKLKGLLRAYGTHIP